MKKSEDALLLDLLAWGIVGLLALLATIPFGLLVVNSLATEHTILNDGYQLWPREWSGEAYALVFQNPSRILNVYGVTLVVTASGTALSLLLSSMAASIAQAQLPLHRH